MTVSLSKGEFNLCINKTVIYTYPINRKSKYIKTKNSLFNICSIGRRKDQRQNQTPMKLIPMLSTNHWWITWLTKTQILHHPIFNQDSVLYPPMDRNSSNATLIWSCTNSNRFEYTSNSKICCFLHFSSTTSLPPPTPLPPNPTIPIPIDLWYVCYC